MSTISRVASTANIRIDSAILDQFKTSLRGQLIQSGDPEYDIARRVYNGMIDKHPAFVVRCADVADVIASVNFAREQHLLLAVRGGGHNGPGFGTCDGGLVIDLAAMHSVHVDPVSATVRVEGGATWGDVNHATAPFGLSVPNGLVSTTGVGGFTLGGGLGYLTRKYGLAIDNLLTADIVLADGSFVTANSEQHPDLFWAIRGGGGNFGVVTSFVFQARPVANIVGGPVLWSLDQAGEVMRWYRQFIVDAPRDISAWFGFITVPPVPTFPEELHLQKVAVILFSYTGPADQADDIFASIREATPPALLFGVGPMPFVALQSAFDALFPTGDQWYWKSDFFNELTEEAIAKHLEFAPQMPTGQSTMHLYPINGAAHDVEPDGTAWGYRHATWDMVIAAIDPDPANNDRMISWARSYWEAMHPFSAGGAYVNMMMEEGNDRVKAAYGENYTRLAAIKHQYDPGNLFRVNQNIQPAG